MRSIIRFYKKKYKCKIEEFQWEERMLRQELELGQGEFQNYMHDKELQEN